MRYEYRIYESFPIKLWKPINFFHDYSICIYHYLDAPVKKNRNALKKKIPLITCINSVGCCCDYPKVSILQSYLFEINNAKDVYFIYFWVMLPCIAEVKYVQNSISPLMKSNMMLCFRQSWIKNVVLYTTYRLILHTCSSRTPVAVLLITTST